MSHEQTQPSLLIRVRDAEDHASWREFDAKYRDLILSYCRARGVQPSDADDVRQMVMVNLARTLRTFEYQPEKGKFRHYLGRAVRNSINQFFTRERSPHAGLDSAILAAVPGENADDEVWEQEWVQHHFRLAMRTVRDTFDPRSVTIFERLLAGESVEAVAADTQHTEQSVYKIKQRVRDRLRELIEAQVADEDAPRG
jgi:RNA polymerase sigma factor (sigma-70 family)